jgi:short subunit dehydrogenase-like uncharacterized protein
LAVLGLALVGCKTGQLPDPNDPAEAGVMGPDVLQQNLKGANEALYQRLLVGEIDEKAYKQYIEQAAEDILEKSTIDRLSPSEAWKYVEVLRTAGRWRETAQLARVAVDFAKKSKNTDRWVNDSLRLAQAEAMLGNVDAAIQDVEAILGVGDTDAAPILLGVYLEVVPAARGKGRDAELAALTEKAIACQMRTKVNENTEPGANFIKARPTHVRRAWGLVVELLNAAGRPKEAIAAAERGRQMMRGL